MDPEYQRTDPIRPKSDLYAFGVIILQLLTARHPNRLYIHCGKCNCKWFFCRLFR
ncbi:putative non-specific serine/threonine protein kinase [Rosa chinensis]|uniref:RING-type E3 ubiquitin transferase n=1 Tax=Rosa chinensis TaxID=74649 RepID=A0A2P6PFY1_ROSCH|nr:putative non-specific serine/threonine protein kinase [Rosa chinensis]